MKITRWGTRVALAAALAGPVAAPLSALPPAQALPPVQAGPPPRPLPAASVEGLLDLQAGHTALLGQRAGTEGGIDLWYTLIVTAGIWVGGYFAYKANKTAIQNRINSFKNNLFNNSVNNSGNNNGG